MPSSASLSYRDLLRKELERRRRDNPRYSIRAFAKDAGISHSFLSQVINKRRNLDEGSAYRVARQLGWSNAQSRVFVNLVRFDNSDDVEHRNLIQSELRPFNVRSVSSYFRLNDKDLKNPPAWVALAILELMEVPDFVPETQWIAKRLGCKVSDVNMALDQLLAQRVLLREGGTLKKVDTHVTLGDQGSSNEVRSFHKDCLERASQALEQQTLTERDFSSYTMAIDPARMEEARTRIRDFYADMACLLEDGQRSAVYNLSLQLFRLDKPMRSFS